MANTRDLRVNIDGDPAGADKAFASAKASAEVFERELAKLERQQKLQEESLKRAEAATKSYGRATSEAAEKATKLGHAAAEAGDKAARSSALAKEAADKLARGEIEAEKAAQAEARALRDVERAAIATAVAQRAAAKAAQDQARQEKQAARDAVVAAATQRLEHLRAAGAVKEHNQLLTKLRKDYKEFDKGFDEMKTAAGTAFTFLKNGMSALSSGAASLAQSLGPGMVAVILGALAVLPAAATLVGGGITLGLGGAFAAIGLDATRGSATAQQALTALKAHAVSALGSITKPWEQTWVALADSARSLLDGIAPDIDKLFRSMAPQVSAFVNQVGRQLPGQLHGFFMALRADFGPIISAFGAALPEALGRSAEGLKEIMDSVAKNPEQFGNLINATGRLVQALGTLVAWTIKIGEAFSYINSLNGKLATSFHLIGEGLGITGGAFTIIGNVMDRFDLSLHKTTGDLASFAFGVATAAVEATKAADAVSQFDDAVTKVVDPSLAAYEANLRLGDSFASLASALKTSHGRMGGQTAATRAAGEAFASTMHQVLLTAKAQEKLTGSSKAGQAVIQQNIAKLWDLAGSNKGAQQQVINLAAAFGVTLPSSARKSKGAVDGVHGALNGIKAKRVTISVDTSRAEAAIQHMRDLAGQPLPQAHYSHGGYVAGYASGGLTGFPGGGMISGAGSTTSDSNLIAVSNKEYIVNARETARWLPLLADINSGKLSAGRNAYLPAGHQSYLPNGLGGTMSGDRLNAVHTSKLTAGKTAVLPPVLHAGTGSVAGGSVRVDIYLHAQAARGGGVMKEIVRELKYDVRTSGQSVNVYFTGRT